MGPLEWNMPWLKDNVFLLEMPLSELLRREGGTEGYPSGMARHLADFFSDEPRIFLCCGEDAAGRSPSRVRDRQTVPTIAGQVLISGAPLRSPTGDLIAVPIPVGKAAAAGVITATMPERDPGGDQEFLLLQVLALFAGRCLENRRLERILKLRLLHCASDPPRNTLARLGLDSCPEPASVARLLAKSFYRELSRAGFTAEHIIDATTEILSQVGEGVKRQRPCSPGRTPPLPQTPTTDPGPLPSDPDAIN